MDELTPEQVESLRGALEQLERELEALLVSTRDGTRPVGLDEPIGRLTRMDAIGQQSVSAANRRSYSIRLQQVRQALQSMQREEYGLCRRCEEPVGYPRLEARPESPYCLDCQEEIDARHAGS